MDSNVAFSVGPSFICGKGSVGIGCPRNCVENDADVQYLGTSLDMKYVQAYLAKRFPAILDFPYQKTIRGDSGIQGCDRLPLNQLGVKRISMSSSRYPLHTDLALTSAIRFGMTFLSNTPYRLA